MNPAEQKRRREAKRRTRLNNMKALYTQHLKTEDEGESQVGGSSTASASSSIAVINSSASTPRTITPRSSQGIGTPSYRVEAQPTVAHSGYHSLAHQDNRMHPTRLSSTSFDPKSENGKHAASSAASRLLGGGTSSSVLAPSVPKAIPAPEQLPTPLPSSTTLITQGGCAYNATDFNGLSSSKVVEEGSDNICQPTSAQEKAFRAAFKAQYEGGEVQSPAVESQSSGSGCANIEGYSDGSNEIRATTKSPPNVPSHSVRMSPIQTPRDMPVSKPLSVDPWDDDAEVDALLQWTDQLDEDGLDLSHS